jgi:hypothetical protein
MTHWRVSDTSANELFKRRVADAARRIIERDVRQAEIEDEYDEPRRFIWGAMLGFTIGALVMFGIMV